MAEKVKCMCTHMFTGFKGKPVAQMWPGCALVEDKLIC